MIRFYLPLLLFTSLAIGQDTRPTITGIASVSIPVREVARSRDFYSRFLGFVGPYSSREGSETTWFKVNDRQTLAITPGNPDDSSQLGFECSDAELMRRYLESQSIEVPNAVFRGPSGTRSFIFTDRD